MRGLLLIAAVATACENLAATAREVLAEFREISGKFGGERACGSGVFRLIELESDLGDDGFPPNNFVSQQLRGCFGR